VPDLHFFRVHPVVVVGLGFGLFAAQASAQAANEHRAMDRSGFIVMFGVEYEAVVRGGVFETQCGVVLCLGIRCSGGRKGFAEVQDYKVYNVAKGNAVCSQRW
jgi:hypothetical protein